MYAQLVIDLSIENITARVCQLMWEDNGKPQFVTMSQLFKSSVEFVGYTHKNEIGQGVFFILSTVGMFGQSGFCSPQAGCYYIASLHFFVLSGIIILGFPCCKPYHIATQEGGLQIVWSVYTI